MRFYRMFVGHADTYFCNSFNNICNGLIQKTVMVYQSLTSLQWHVIVCIGAPYVYTVYLTVFQSVLWDMECEWPAGIRGCSSMAVCGWWATRHLCHRVRIIKDVYQIQNSELRTQNYLFGLIHLHFCYNNTIQYNIIQYNLWVCLYFFWSRRLLLRSDKTTVMGATYCIKIIYTYSSC